MVYSTLWQRIAWTVYAPHCLLCGARGRESVDICAACARELPLNTCCCDICSLPLVSFPADPARRTCGRCLQRPPAYRRAQAAFVYAAPLDHLVQRFKYGGRLEYGRLLSTLFAERVRQQPLRGVDRLLPVPLHPSRLRERGFNQALTLARALSRVTSISVAQGLAHRRRATPAQTALSAGQRRRNVRGAFRLSGGVAGLRFAIVDDVLTTGATVDELSRVLLHAGAADVQVCALARAHTPTR